MKVPFFTLERYLKDFGEDLERVIKEVLYSGSYASGKKVEEFEEKWGNYNNCYVCATANGTVALELVLKYYELSKNIPKVRNYTSPNSFTATIEAMIHNGRKPHFLDTDDTGNLDINLLNNHSALCNFDLLLLVNLYGNPINIEKINSFTTNPIIKIIDNAQGAGCLLNNKHMEDFADATTYSFFPTKVLATCGEGGSVNTRKKDLYEFCKQYSHHGQKEKYIHEIVGNNYRMSEIEAACLIYNLTHLEEIIEKRNRAANRYYNNLKDCNKIKFPYVRSQDRCSYYVYSVYVEHRNEIKKKLEDNGISTGLHYPLSLHLQPCYRYLEYKNGNFPNAEKQFDKQLSLPLFYNITNEEIDFICDGLLKILD